MIKNEINIDNLMNIVQVSNINFLLGSGMSMPYLKTLGNIEMLLTDLKQNNDICTVDKKIIEASIYKRFYTLSIEKNIDIFNDSVESKDVLKYYIEFCSLINKLLLLRKNTLLGKQVNVFTTNYDVFLEKSLEERGFEYNDGFSGKFKPKYSISNFKKSIFKKSLYYENNSEIPIFNILKLHGSLTWKKQIQSQITCDTTLELLKNVQKIEGEFLEVDDNSNIEDLIDEICWIGKHSHMDDFLERYKKIMFVNPTKKKFEDTLMDQMYYDLLRIYSNELEKENTVLFVMGFSFADEHIRELTLRVANSNPTLSIIIFAYSIKSGEEIAEALDISRINNKNIIIQVPPELEDEEKKDSFNYDFNRINNEIFKPLLKSAVGKSE